MKKILFICIVSVLCLCSAFAISHKEPGRDSITASLTAGKIPATNAIDSNYYLDDFAFPYRAQKNELLSFFTHTDKSQILSCGDTVSIQVGLRASNNEAFTLRDVNYVLYINNPSFAINDRGKSLFTAALTKMLETKTPNSRISVYVPETSTLRFVTSVDAIAATLEAVGNSEKTKATESVLIDIGKAIDANTNGLPWRVMCISDQDMFKTSQVKDAFSYVPCLYSNSEISFSYVGYGIISEWAIINKMFEFSEGNIYYEKTYKALENRIVSDFDKFSHSRIKDIQVKIAYADWTQKEDVIYSIPSMEYDGHTILLDSVKLPASINIPVANEEFTRMYVASDNANSYLVANCSLTFTNESDSTVVYKTTPVYVTYTNDPIAVQTSTNKIVQQSLILQNSGSVFKSLEEMCNEEKFAQALLLIDSQIKDLKFVQTSSKDKQIEVDVQNFKKAEEIILKMMDYEE